MPHIKPLWYILLYHDVSWEENCYVRSYGGTAPPDVFRAHVKSCRELGELVSIPEGVRRCQNGPIDSPLFSFWFDDGLIGVRKHAAPILEEFAVVGATSVCSEFLKRSDFFWRFKLSYLNSVDGMRFLRSRLRQFGYKNGDSISTFTLDHFSPEMLACIDDLYERFTTEDQRADAFRMFDTKEGILNLQRKGWTIANHSARHYPIIQGYGLDRLKEDYWDCEQELSAILGGPTQYWVIPFDRRTAPDSVARFNEFREDRWIVFVGDKPNDNGPAIEQRCLYRIVAPWSDRTGIKRVIAGT